MTRLFCLWSLGALSLAVPVASVAQTNTKAIGRIEYSVVPLTPAHVPFPHEYVRLRLVIKKFGDATVLSTKDPNFLGQLFSGVFKKSRYVFVGLRFSRGPFELLPTVTPSTTKPAVPFFTVLYAERGTAEVGPPHTDDNDLVLGPRDVGSADVDLELSTAWGKKVTVNIPKAAWDVAQAASAAYVSLPAAMVNAGLSTKLTPADRDAADKYFSDALSFDTKDLAAKGGPDGINVLAITKDQLTNGAIVDVAVYDRDATDTEKRRLLVEFTLTTEYVPSVLPGVPTTPPQDLSQIFKGWDQNSNIVAGDPSTSVSGVLARVPSDQTYGSPVANMGAASGNFGVVCTKLNSYFGGLGFNQYDQYALTWATLQQSDFLRTFAKLSRDNQVSEVASQGGSDCPGDATNSNFRSVGLTEIPALKAAPPPPPPVVPETAPPTADMLKTLYKFAHDWANPAEDKLAIYADADQAGQFDITRDASNKIGLAGDGPTVPGELASALRANGSRIGAFAHSQAHPREWCVTYTIAGTAPRGKIRFSATNGQIIDKIDMASAPTDCGGQ